MQRLAQVDPKHRLLREAAEIALLALTALIVVLLIAPRVFSTDVPLAVVASQSMEPVLHAGDLIVVSGASKPAIGDVIVYVKPNGELIVHRLIEVREELASTVYVTKGDANPVPDIPFPAYMVKGRVELVIPYIGSVRLALEKAIHGLLGLRS